MPTVRAAVMVLMLIASAAARAAAQKKQPESAAEVAVMYACLQGVKSCSIRIA